MISIVSSLITYNADQRRSTLLITIKVDHFVWNTCYPISGKCICSCIYLFNLHYMFLHEGNTRKYVL